MVWSYMNHDQITRDISSEEPDPPESLETRLKAPRPCTYLDKQEVCRRGSEGGDCIIGESESIGRSREGVARGQHPESRTYKLHLGGTCRRVCNVVPRINYLLVSIQI